MSLSELYQEVLLDHNRRPRNFGELADANRVAHGHNPLCGDRFTVYVKVADDRIDAVQFQGSGCAISKASASLMTDAVKGLSLDEARALFDRFHAMVTAPVDRPADTEALGKLEALAGVREFPIRIKCASLAWHALKAAIADANPGVVKTE